MAFEWIGAIVFFSFDSVIINLYKSTAHVFIINKIQVVALYMNFEHLQLVENKNFSLWNNSARFNSSFLCRNGF